MNQNNHYINNILEQDCDCYLGTDVLINKFQEKDPEKLFQYEKHICSVVLLKMRLSEYTGDFGIEHYKDIHRKLFGYIYPFAGKLRGKDIIKGKTYFCRAYYIHPCLNSTLEKMKEEMLTVNNIDEYSEKLAKFYSDLNLIHPFREGNGRTLREFLRQYVQYLNNKLDFGTYDLNYSEMSNELLLKHTIEDNQEGLTQEFKKALVLVKIDSKLHIK